MFTYNVHMSYCINLHEAEDLVRWYQSHKRELPWRDQNSAYKVWISEIMLQQTRIEAVRERFVMFINELPDAYALAECDDDRLMKLWEGMGYYSRARNLKKCAQVLCRDYQGTLPADGNLLRKLPGIGPYTAGAISSIAYGLPAAAVDGNVLRVLARCFLITDDIRQKSVRKDLEETILSLFNICSDSDFISGFNQAIMELGETVCVPNGKPHCADCPMNKTCRAFLQQKTEEIPYRSPLKKRKIIERTLFVMRDGDRFLLHKRPKTGLLASLFEFPGIDQKLTRTQALQMVEQMGIIPLQIRSLPESKHIFTHLEWHMTAYEIRCEQITSLTSEDMFIVNKKELSQMAVPSAFRTYIDYYALRDD